MNMNARNEHGFVMIWFALMLPTLVMFGGFVLGIADIYLQGSRMQNAADHGALSGSLYLPNDPTKANREASESARSLALPTDIITAHPVAGKPTQQEVTITRTVTGVLLMPSTTITKTAIAQYRPYVPMGSPSNCAGCGPAGGNYYLNISAAGTPKETGDRYNSGGPEDNDDYQEAQQYVMRVPVSGNVKLEVYDAPFNEQGDNCTVTGCTGDHQTDAKKMQPNTSFEVTNRNREVVCAKQTFTGGNRTGYLAWVTLCNKYLGAGDYVVSVSNSQSTAYNGLNRFSLRSSAGTSVFAKGRLVVYAKDNAAVTTFDLARVNESYAGEVLNVDLFDIGDAENGATVQVLPPTDANVSTFTCADNPTCTYTGLSAATQNGKTKHLEVNMPKGYTCNATAANGCWVRLRITYGRGQVNDTTSWEVYASGTPNMLTIKDNDND